MAGEAGQGGIFACEEVLRRKGNGFSGEADRLERIACFSRAFAATGGYKSTLVGNSIADEI